MALQSMTGFSRSEGLHATGRWVWELRSVNNKGLDLRMRLPYGFETIEVDCKKAVASAFSRGSIQVSLQFSKEGSANVPSINPAALEAVLSVAAQLQERIGAAPPTVDGILAIKGILEITETDLTDDEVKSRNKEVLSGLKTAIVDLTTARESEGEAIVAVMSDQVSKIGGLVAKIEADPSRTMDAIRQRLQQQLAPLLEEGSDLDPQRLHQEAAYLATKADLREELDRLVAHVVAGQKLLSSAGPAGRKLDFLAQEFNRECNTICSKSNAPSVTGLGLEMKIIVDQLREQTQNLE
ncbi:MAG: YicC/YloC family endoribonuclease [Rhizobiaceae bacterium]